MENSNSENNKSKGSNGTRPANVAAQVVDMMAAAEVKNVYGITGDSLNAVTEAIADDGRIKFVHVRHEETGAFAASAEAQLTGRMAACAGSSGPGHVHLINGLYDAQRANAPVFAIASTCPSAMFGTGYFQETNPTLLFSNCSVYNETAVSPDQVPHMVQAAMQEAVSRGGVGVVGLPADLITEKAAEVGSSTLPFVTERLPQPTDEEISGAADLINNGDKITIFAGSGAKGAVKELMELAAKVNAPVVTTFKSQLELTGDCPNYVGHLGYMGHYSAVDAVSEPDVLLLIGMNFPFPGFFPTDKKIIQVDVRAERLGRKAKVDLGIRSDSREFLMALLPKLEKKNDRTFLDSRLADYAVIRKKLQEPVENPGKKGAVRPEFVFAMLDRMADDDAVFTVDTGMNCVWSSHYLTQRVNRAMIGSFTHGSMANAMPMAIGAAQCQPGRQVISLSGDGGLTMLMGDLLTIVQYKLPVKILVADNRSLAYVKWEMELAGYKPVETSLTNPDFGEMARSIGFQAETVDSPEELEGAMERWLKADGPALLSVVTDTDAASFVFSREAVDGARPASLTENFMPLGE